MLLCVGNFFGSTSDAEWTEYRTGAKKGKEKVVLDGICIIVLGIVLFSNPLTCFVVTGV